MATAYVCRGCGTPYTTEENGTKCCGLMSQAPLKVGGSRIHTLIVKMPGGRRIKSDYEMTGTTLKSYEGHNSEQGIYVAGCWHLDGASWVYDDSEVE